MIINTAGIKKVTQLFLDFFFTQFWVTKQATKVLIRASELYKRTGATTEAVKQR